MDEWVLLDLGKPTLIDGLQVAKRSFSFAPDGIDNVYF
jgi:hypothetical protein